MKAHQFYSLSAMYSEFQLEACDFESLGLSLIGRPDSRCGSVTAQRKFCSCFGATTVVCSKLWKLFPRPHPKKFEPKHMMWGLLFLKLYSTEHVHAGMVETDEKNFRKWAWYSVNTIAEFKTVSFFGLLLFMLTLLRLLGNRDLWTHRLHSVSFAWMG